MRKYQAKEVPCNILFSQNNCKKIYPYIRDWGGDKSIYCISPIHGRSFLICPLENGNWIVSKGNGISYSMHSFIDVSETDNYIWGALTKENAIRDYKICNEVSRLGIKTNQMHAVLELDYQLIDKGTIVTPCLLQYDVVCPYRLCDYPFMPSSTFKKNVISWSNYESKYSEAYLIAAEVLVRNLKILHDNKIMHNALHVQNYTWALELLDFESSRTEQYPYSNLEYEKNVLMLLDGEIMKTYEIINYIGWCLGGKIDYAKIDSIFKDYGFNLRKYNVDRYSQHVIFAKD